MCQNHAPKSATRKLNFAVGLQNITPYFRVLPADILIRNVLLLLLKYLCTHTPPPPTIFFFFPLLTRNDAQIQFLQNIRAKVILFCLLKEKRRMQVRESYIHLKKKIKNGIIGGGGAIWVVLLIGSSYLHEFLFLLLLYSSFLEYQLVGIPIIFFCSTCRCSDLNLYLPSYLEISWPVYKMENGMEERQSSQLDFFKFYNIVTLIFVEIKLQTGCQTRL